MAAIYVGGTLHHGVRELILTPAMLVWKSDIDVIFRFLYCLHASLMEGLGQKNQVSPPSSKGAPATPLGKEQNPPCAGAAPRSPRRRAAHEVRNVAQLCQPPRTH